MKKYFTCDSCRYHKAGTSSETTYCCNPDVNQSFSGIRKAGLVLWKAREICDLDSDGIFVYFEPKNPAAGATFQKEERAFAAAA